MHVLAWLVLSFGASLASASPFYEYRMVAGANGYAARVDSAGSINSFGDVVFIGYDSGLLADAPNQLIEIDRTGNARLVNGFDCLIGGELRTCNNTIWHGAEPVALISDRGDKLVYQNSKFRWSGAYDGTMLTPLGDQTVLVTQINGYASGYELDGSSFRPLAEAFFLNYPIEPIAREEELLELMSSYVHMNDTGSWVHAGGTGDRRRPNPYEVPELGFVTKSLTENSFVRGERTIFPGSAPLDQSTILSYSGANDLIDDLRPQIADDGSVLIREGALTVSPVALYRPGGERVPIAELTSGTGEFGLIHPAVGLSASGKAAVFAGNRGDGDGIFLSVDDGTGFVGPGTTRAYINVVGEGKNDLGFGEARTPGDSTSRRLFFEAFDFDEGLFILHFENASPATPGGPDDGLVNDSVVIAFMGRPNAEKVLYPEQAPSPRLFRDTMGLWTVRVDFITHPGTGDVVPKIHSPVPVAQVGDVFQGVIVAEIDLLDPLAKALADADGNDRTQFGRADHRLLFAIEDPLGLRQLVIAEAFDVDADGLFDHWETDGIDMDGDGVADLDLPELGADPMHKDIFLQIDYLEDRDTTAFGTYTHEIAPGVTQKLAEIMAAAPVQNPDGTTGIRMHIDAGSLTDDAGVPYSNLPEGVSRRGGQYLTMDGNRDNPIDYVYHGFEEDEGRLTGLNARSINSIRAETFGTFDNRGRDLAFHYLVSSEWYRPAYQDNGVPRRPAVLTVAAAPADDLIVFTENLPDDLTGTGGMKVILGRHVGEMRRFERVAPNAIRLREPLPSPLANGNTVVLFRGNSGVSEWARGHALGSLPVNDLILSLRGAGLNDGRVGNRIQQWATILHEGGHNLGLVHCGTSGNADDCKYVIGELQFEPLGPGVLVEGSRSEDVLVRLNAEPSDPVTVALESPDPSVVIEPNVVTIAPGDWEVGRPITVSYADDDDAPQSPLRRVRIEAGATSADDRFDGKTASTRFNVYDDDQAELVYLRVGRAAAATDIDLDLAGAVDEDGVPLHGFRELHRTVTEGGAPLLVDVMLSRPPAGEIETTFREAGVDVEPETLTFNALNWNVPQVIRVSVEDDIDAPVYLRAEFSNDVSDPYFEGDANVVYNPAHSDDDSVEIRVERPAGRIVLSEEDQDSVTVQVALTSDPGGDYVVAIDPTSQLAVSSASGSFDANTRTLQFDSTNWGDFQEVVITPVQDVRSDGYQLRLVRFSGTATDADSMAIPIYIRDGDPLQEDHLSIMSYAHSLPPDVIIEGYAGPDTPRVDEWSNLSFGRATNLRSVGTSSTIPDSPSRELNLDPGEYREIHGRFPDMDGPELSLESPAPTGVVAVGSTVEVRVAASDLVGRVAFVRAEFDRDGDGTVSEDERLLMAEVEDGVYAVTTAPLGGGAGSRALTILAEDGESNRNRLVQSIGVRATNRAPIARSRGLTASPGATIAFTLGGEDPDHAPITFEIADPPANGTLEGTPPSLRYTPDPGFTGFDAFTFVVRDGALSSAPATVSIMVGDLNTAPTLDFVEDLRLLAGSTRGYALRGVDTDGHPLRFSLARAPAFVRLEDAGDGTARLAFEPFLGDVGRHPVEVVVSDGWDSAVRRFEVAVVTRAEVNNPPSLAPIGQQNVPADFSVTVPIVATDPDGDALRIYGAALPGFVTVFDDGGGVGRLVISPAVGDEGVYSVAVRATDELRIAGRAVTVVVAAADVTAPEILATFPADGDRVAPGLSNGWVLFSEPIDLATVAAGDLRVTDELGAAVPGADLTWVGGNAVAVPSFDPLTPGRYSLSISAGGFTDFVGNATGLAPILNLFDVAAPAAGGGGRPLDTQPVWPIESATERIGSGDFDGDGLLDVVLSHDADLEQGLTVLRGTGAGAYARVAELPLAEGVTLEISDSARRAPVHVVDLDGDGFDDVVAGLETRLSIFFGDAGATFARATTIDLLGFGLGTNPDRIGELASGDLNGDGFEDLVVSLDYVFVSLLGDGSGAFGPPLSTSSSTAVGRAKYLALGDLDADGDLDVVDGRNVFLGDGAAGFTRNAVGFDSSGLAALFSHTTLADVNGDGVLDVVGSNWARTDRNVRVSLGNGDGTFHAVGPTGGIVWNIVEIPTGGNFIQDLVVRDLDDDGDPDFVIEFRPDLLDNDRQQIGVFRNEGTGSFVLVDTLPTLDDYRWPRIDDYDGDGLVDLGYVAGDGFSFLPGFGALQFAPFRIVATERLDAAGFGDLDGDGDLDAAVADRSTDLVRIYRNDGAANLVAGASYTFLRHNDFRALDVYTVALEDIDGDGHGDLVVGGIGTVATRRSNGDGTFASPRTYPVSARDELELADLDGDGHVDLVAVDRSTFVVLLSDGDGTFTIEPSETVYLDTRGDVALGDVDGDGIVDLGWTVGNSNAIAVLEGQGDGTFVATRDAIRRAIDVAVNAAGEIYVVNQAVGPIRKLDPNGEPLATFGDFGSGPGGLSSPRSVALDSRGHVFVTDDFDHRVVHYDPNGVYVGEFGSRGFGPGQFDRPWSIAIDATDQIFVADKENFRIQKFDASGTYLGEFGNSGDGTGPGELEDPEALDLDAAGNVYVLDLNRSRPNDAIVHVFDNDGLFLREFATLGNDPDPLGHQPLGLAVGPTGDVYVSEGFQWSEAHRVQRFDAFGNVQQVFGRYGSLLGQLWEPRGVAVDASGNLLVAGRMGVQRYAPSGDPIDLLGADLRAAGKPVGLAIADLDADGFADIVTSNGVGVSRDPFADEARSDDSGAHTVSVLFGRADGTYEPHYDCAVGRDPLHPIVRDFDGDGFLDVATSSRPDHTITILRGGEDGLFTQRVTLRVDDDPISLVAGALDGDGTPDFATSSLEADSLALVLGSAAVWDVAEPADCTLPSTPPPGGGTLVASAGPDQSVTSGRVVLLDGSGSIGTAAASVLVFEWIQTAGPPVDLIGADGPAPIFEAGAVGLVELTLTVREGELSATDTVAIDVVPAPPVNTRPVAAIANDPTIAAPGVLTLDGSTSLDPDGDPIDYAWRVLSAPIGSAAAIADAAAPTTTLTVDERGEYVVELTVGDGALRSLPAIATIEATGNTRPIAVASVSAAIDLPGEALLDGSASFDVDGDPLAWSWRVVSAPAGSTAAPSDSAAATTALPVDLPGNYVVELVVNDGALASVPVSATIVATGNRPPTANAGPDRVVELPGSVELNGIGSLDPDGDPLSWSWSIVSQPAGSSAGLSPGGAPERIVLTPDVAGTYELELVVNDGRSDSAPDRVTVVASANDPPIADAGRDVLLRLPGSARLDGSGSRDPEGDPLTYAWSIVGAPSGAVATLTGETSAVATLNVSVAGSYELELVVSDGSLASAPDRVTVTAYTNVAPIADAGPDQTLPIGSTVALDGTASVDPDGMPAPLVFAWRFESLPAGSALAFDDLIDRNTSRPRFTPDVPGVYALGLYVNDRQDEDDDRVVITIESDVVVVPPVEDLTARAKDGKIDLVWTPVAGAVYDVYRSEVAGGPYALVAAGHASDYAVYADFGLENGTAYHYVVTVVVGGVESAESNEASATPSARGGRGDDEDPVPEPGVGVGLIVGLAGLVGAGRRRAGRARSGRRPGRA